MESSTASGSFDQIMPLPALPQNASGAVKLFLWTWTEESSDVVEKRNCLNSFARTLREYLVERMLVARFIAQACFSSVFSLWLHSEKVI